MMSNDEFWAKEHARELDRELFGPIRKREPERPVVRRKRQPALVRVSFPIDTDGETGTAIVWVPLCDLARLPLDADVLIPVREFTPAPPAQPREDFENPMTAKRAAQYLGIPYTTFRNIAKHILRTSTGRYFKDDLEKFERSPKTKAKDAV